MRKNQKNWLPVMVGILFPVLCVGIQMLLQICETAEENAVTKATTIIQPNTYLPVQEEPLVLSEEKLYESANVVCYEDRIFTRLSIGESQADKVAELASTLNAFCPEGTDLYILPVPKRVLWENGYEEDLAIYTGYMNRLRSALNGKAVLTDPYASLSEHIQEALYFNTEDSWNALGAYYGVLPFCEQVGIEPFGLEDYVRAENVGHFIGDLTLLPELSQFSFLNLQDDELVLYDLAGAETMSRVISYEDEKLVAVNKPLVTLSSRNTSSVLTGDFVRAIVPGEGRSESKKDEYLLLLCDQEGKLLVPYLKNYYKGVYVVNISRKSDLKYDISILMNEYQINDVLLAQDVSELGKEGYYAALTEMTAGIREEKEMQEELTDGDDIP